MTPPSLRTTGQHHGDLRNQLEKSALELVGEKGPRGFSLAEVTRRAGVSVAAPYKHFRDRDALLAALAQRGFEEQHRVFGAAIAGASDPSEQFARFSSAYVRFAVEQRALFEITFRSGLDKGLYSGLAEAGDRVLGLLREPASRLEVSPEQQLELVYAVAASAHGFAMFLLEGVFGPISAGLDRATSRAEHAARILSRRVDTTDI